MSSFRQRSARHLRAQSGFTMIITLGVLFVTSLLLVAAFTAANGEIASTKTNADQKQAYYAALAGVQEYEYLLQSNPDYWESCVGPKNTVAEEPVERYEVTLLPASSAPAGTTECLATNPFVTEIESSGSIANTFRIKSVGYAGKEKRSIVATFQVTGFLDFVYFTNFESRDPSLYSAPAGCKGHYYSEWSKAGLKCEVITFFTGDKVNGPMHTNDATRMEGSPTFGRSPHTPADHVQIDGGAYPEDMNFECKGSPVFNTAKKCYEHGETLIPPESDTSLTAYVEPGYEFTGQTQLVLKGTTIGVVRWEGGVKKEETLAWPKNGLIYVGAESCSFPFESSGSDSKEELEQTRSCGDVYVSGSYSKSLTVAGENNVIINGSLYPTSVEGKLGNEPTGTATLGLIASEYVRVYHPVGVTYKPGGGGCNKGDTPVSGGLCEYANTSGGCDAPNLSSSEDPNKWGIQSNIWVYAAILSTSHSFLVDNYNCGTSLGEAHVYGAIAQDYRGIVATSGGTGYVKDYKYDGRLAADEPPYFLAPLKAGWKVIRETAPTPG
jgi:type II secretory pathway pseudopilin PulG